MNVRLRSKLEQNFIVQPLHNERQQKNIMNFHILILLLSTFLTITTSQNCNLPCDTAADCSSSCNQCSPDGICIAPSPSPTPQDYPIWPIPTSLTCNGITTTPLFSSTINVNLIKSTSRVATEAIARGQILLRSQNTHNGTITAVSITLLSNNDFPLNRATNYTYTINYNS